MANPIVQTSAVGVAVAVDVVGTSNFQQLKLVDGAIGETTPIIATSGPPAAAAFGLVVAPKPHAVTIATGTLSVSGPVQVSGTVTANGSVSLSGTGIVSIVPGVSVTIQAGVSVVAQVSGTINVATVQTILSTVNVAIVAGAGGGGSVTTASPSISATGQVVWIAGGQHTTGVPVRVTGTVDVSVSVSAAVENITAISTIITQLGTQVVTIAQTSVVAQVSGTVTISPTTFTVNTAVVAGASITIQQGASVVAQASGTVTVINGVSVAFSAPYVTTAAPSTSAAGIVVWNANGGDVTVENITVVSTIVTILGTQVVTIVPGVSVTIQQGASVSAPAFSGVVASSVPATSNAFGIPVWLVGGQTATGVPIRVIVSTGLVGISGSVLVTITGSVPVVGSVQVTGNVGISGTAAVTGTVLALLAQTTVTQAAVTGILTWLAPTQTITAMDVGRTRVLIVVGSTVGSAGTTLAFTLQVGTTAPVAGTTSWVIPAGKTFRLLAADAIVDCVTTTPAHYRLALLASGALPTWTSAVQYYMPVQAVAFSAGIGGAGAVAGIEDIPAGLTVGIAHTISASGTLQQGHFRGFLFP